MSLGFHAVEAERLIALSSIQPDTDSASAISNAAQVHALLALVEQQRIANLIALASYEGDSEVLDGLRADAGDALVRWVPHSPDDEHPETRLDIEAALGLGRSR